MQTGSLGRLISILLDFLKNDEEIKIVIDAFLDKVEDRIAASPNKFDDLAIGSCITLIRKTMNIPDNDKAVTINADTVTVTENPKP